MKHQKHISAAKDAANKKNAKKSTGPKRGKRVTRMNATTHGFFARELVLNDQERRQLETIRRSLHPQLAPETAMQHIKFAEIVICIGRCKLGLRADMRYINRLLGQDSPQAQPGQTEAPGARPEWYLAGRQGLSKGMRLLADIKQEFLSLGRIDEKWHAVLDQAFGPELRQLLTGWTTSDETVVMVARQLTMHSKTYNLPLPAVFDTEQRSAEDGKTRRRLLWTPSKINS